MYTTRITTPRIQNSRQFQSLINSFFGTDTSGGRSIYSPKVNVSEIDDNIKMEIALPGWTKKDVRIELNDGKLEVKGTAEKTEDKSSEKVLRKEFSRQSFSRTFNLPENVSQDEISATFTDGILRIDLKKAEAEQPTLRAIEIT